MFDSYPKVTEIAMRAVRCPCSRLAALHGAPRTQKSSLLDDSEDMLLLMVSGSLDSIVGG